MKNKALSFFMSILAIVIAISPVVETFANEQLIFDDNYKYMNEYDMYCELKEKSDEELSIEGYSNKEIKEIKNFDFEEAIKQRAKLPTETLLKYGYTQKEIEELKELEKLETIPTAVLKEISRDTLGSSIRVAKKGTILENGTKVNYVDLKYSFKWKRVPVIMFIDFVAIAFNSSNSNQFIYKIVSDGTHKLTANLTELETGSKTSQIVSWKFDTNSQKAVSAKFAVGMKNSSGKVTHMCYSGSGTIRLTNTSSKSRLYIDACYGHTIINIAPSFSVNLKGVSASISPKKGIDARHDTGYYYSDFTIDNSYVYSGVVLGL